KFVQVRFCPEPPGSFERDLCDDRRFHQPISACRGDKSRRVVETGDCLANTRTTKFEQRTQSIKLWGPISFEPDTVDEGDGSNRPLLIAVQSTSEILLNKWCAAQNEIGRGLCIVPTKVNCE